LDLSAPLQTLPGIGPVRAGRLAEAGFETVGDLLAHLPFRYEDRSVIVSVGEALAAFDASSPAGEAAAAVTLRGRLEGVRAVRLRRRGLSLVRGTLRDGSGSLQVLWFNQPYLAGRIDGDTEYLVHGRLRLPKAAARRGKAVPPELVNPSCEPAEGALQGGLVVPVYPALGPLGPAAVRRLVAKVFDALTPDEIDRIPEPLPPDLLERHRLPALGDALVRIHRPGAGGETPDAEELNRRASPGHRRLVYGELLEQQLALAVLRRGRSAVRKRRRYDRPDRAERARRIARAALPFRLTPAQRRALEEIAVDLRRPYPMARLLQGDVGSGKTIVALLALVLALESGYQGAFMAPTELLAEQHYRRIVERLGGHYRVGLLTGSNPELAAVRADLAAGRVDLAVGTHALVQEGVRFQRLGLVVIDEQHRFGVVQRQLLEGKGERPDVLVMTATPIPRTLALTAFGDLEVSVIDELPPGRRGVQTETRPPADRPAVYRRLAERLAAGERAYVVFPRIGPGESEGEEAGEAADGSADGSGPSFSETEVPDLTTAGAALVQEIAGHLGGGWGGRWRDDWALTVHGRMDREAREQAMAAFSEGRARLLLATTVIEVGVDVPEATVMVIEGAERFGLSQLHQLRGRVGRGDRPGWCVALPSGTALTEQGRARLEAFVATTDGFEIAEQDLRIRGFGDLLGTRQAGLARFRVADPFVHGELLERAREDAAEVAERLAEAPLAVLRRRVERALARRRRLLAAGR